MRRRWVKLLGATLPPMGCLVRQVLAVAAFIAGMLLHDLTAVIESDVWYVVATFGMWLAVAIAVQLTVSASRRYVRPSLITMPDRLDPAEADAWADLERRLGGEGR